MTSRENDGPYFEVRGSGIHGLGGFAIRRIPKGTRIAEYVGERLTAEELDRRYGDDAREDGHTFLFHVSGDLYIAGPNLEDAMHGDRVVVRIERVRDGGRAEGKIVRVLERNASTVVGRFVVDPSGLSFVTPFDRKLTSDIQVPAGERLQMKQSLGIDGFDGPKKEPTR